MSELKQLINIRGRTELAPNLAVCELLRFAKHGLFGVTPAQHQENVRINRKRWKEWMMQQKNAQYSK